LTVVDDGRGFDPSGLADVSGRGLHNMARRADLLGGRLRVTSQRGRGTEVRLEVPLAM
jgi:signal transduction histidine kinase